MRARWSAAFCFCELVGDGAQLSLLFSAFSGSSEAWFSARESYHAPLADEQRTGKIRGNLIEWARELGGNEKKNQSEVKQWNQPVVFYPPANASVKV